MTVNIWKSYIWTAVDKSKLLCGTFTNTAPQFLKKLPTLHNTASHSSLFRERTIFYACFSTFIEGGKEGSWSCFTHKFEKLTSNTWLYLKGKLQIYLIVYKVLGKSWTSQNEQRMYCKVVVELSGGYI